MRRLPVILSILFLVACPDNTTRLCDHECSLGEVCDYEIGQCVIQPLEAYKGPLPGRNARIGSAGSKIVYTGILPETLELLAGDISETTHDIKILTKLTRERPLAVATTATRTTVVWLGDDARFSFATRTPDTTWTFGIAESETIYAGTSNFTAAYDGADTLFIAFQATDRKLRVLSSADLTEWDVALVDDGGIASNGIECPDSVRGTRRPGGVGIEPSMVATPDGMWISYQDADCGDLRLARSSGPQWSIDVVDTGTPDASPVAQRGRTGRWSSIGVGPSGRVGIAYQDELRGTLKYATPADRAFLIETVDDGYELDVNANQRKDTVGAWARLAFDSRGAPTIVYMNQSSADLRLAQRPQDGARWVQRTLVSDGIIGFHAGLIELAQGRLVISERLVPSNGIKGSELVEVWE